MISSIFALKMLLPLLLSFDKLTENFLRVKLLNLSLCCSALSDLFFDWLHVQYQIILILHLFFFILLTAYAALLCPCFVVINFNELFY